ncbi:hypothetical protein N0V87_005021 [Didymella glomerata]|uniref:DUF7918 domain-containing protein n=1 Tax=Didymella glomerata TaxID=749621 RepID=A0A9W9BZX8_9PLEO|nr:hypothetical protein N0V87_005021 [Didymella glomerata]
MAVLFQVPGLEVDIVDDQKRSLYEYEDEEDAQTPSEAEEEQRTYEMTRYIESKSGAKFGIRHSYSETFGAEYGIRLEICVDGCIARKLIVPPTDLYTDDGQHVCSFKYEHRNSKRLRRDFQFADLEVGELSDDNSPSSLHGNITAIGTISVTFYRVKNVRSQPVTSIKKNSSRYTRIERLNEKSMKGDTRSHTFT